MRLSSLLPCWQHFELGMELGHVSCKLYEVKGFILTFFTFRAGLYGCLVFRDFRISHSVESWFSFAEIHRESGERDLTQGISAHTVWLLQLMDISLLRVKPSRVGLA